jgi:molybdopterin molybdotransferase
MTSLDPQAPREDIRLRGFSRRVPVEQALAWVDAHAPRLGAEPIGAGEAAGRVPAAPVEAAADLPPVDRAAEDGYALRSSETVGAGAYNPLRFGLQEGGAPLPLASAALVAAGAALPEGADAVLPFGAAQLEGSVLEVVGAVAAGAGVERRGRELRAGTAIIGSARPLRAADLGMLAVLGVERLDVVRRPRVRLVIAGPKRPGRLAGAPGDAAGPELRALVARDGGVVESVVPGVEGRSAISAAMVAPGADVVLVAGRAGAGPDDEAPLALAEAGRLAIHGLALRPGGSAGLGLVGSLPVVLLPGDPLACLCAYEIVCGRLLRRLGGRDPGLPHAVREAEVGRKLVSAVGFLDVCQVRLDGGLAEQIGSVQDGGLASAVRADGFVLIPPSLEGHAPGARVTVHLY